MNFIWYENLNCVRYYLAGINQLDKTGIASDSEFKLAWDKQYCENPHFILRKSMFRGDLSKKLTLSLNKRYIDLTYIGKAWIWYGTNIPRVANSVELPRDWPRVDDEYFYLLSKSRYLYTYDHITSVIDDAIMFGAIPLFLDHNLKKNDAWLNSINQHAEGCYGFIGDDLNKLRTSFKTNRKNFIMNQMNDHIKYFINLKLFCNNVENYFGFSF